MVDKLQIIIKPNPKDKRAAFVLRYDDEARNWTVQLPPAPEEVSFGELHSVLNSPILPRAFRDQLREFLAGAGLCEWLA